MDMKQMIEELEGTDAMQLLCGLPYRSYCGASGRLVELGLWDDDGQVSDLAREIIKQELIG